MQHRTSGKWASVVMLAAVVITMTACTQLYDSSDLVGGGYNIHYVAPSNGTAFVVEKDGNRILETHSLKTGEAFEYHSPVPNRSYKAGLLDSVRNALFGSTPSGDSRLLYFVPNHKDAVNAEE